MKSVNLFYFLILFTAMFSTTLLSSCGVDWSEDNLRPVEDSLGYEKLLGTYVFRPTAEQAERLMRFQ